MTAECKPREKWKAEKFAKLPPRMQAAKALQDLAAQMAKHSASIMKLALEFAGGTDVGRISVAANTYISEGCIAGDEVAAVERKFEKHQPQEWQDKRRSQRAAAERQKARIRLNYSRELAPSVEWTVKTALEYARERRDILGLAIAYLDQKEDDGSVAKQLIEYLAGQCGIHHVKAALEHHGVTWPRLTPMNRTEINQIHGRAEAATAVPSSHRSSAAMKRAPQSAV